MAITLDECIDHHAHLIQPDMHRGVGNLAVALFCRMGWITTSKTNMTLQIFAVIGQKIGKDFTGGLRMTDMAVMLVACCLHGFVVGNDCGL